MSYPTLSPKVLSDGDELQTSHYLELDPVPLSAYLARQFVSDHVPELSDETGETLLLLTSELVTNAILHARTVMAVGILIGRHSLVVGVHDLDLETAWQEPYAEREGGWGLNLVAALAQCFATTRHSRGGKTVWFRLSYEDARGRPSDAA